MHPRSTRSLYTVVAVPVPQPPALPNPHLVVSPLSFCPGGPQDNNHLPIYIALQSTFLRTSHLTLKVHLCGAKQQAESLEDLATIIRQDGHQAQAVRVGTLVLELSLFLAHPTGLSEHRHSRHRANQLGHPLVSVFHTKPPAEPHNEEISGQPALRIRGPP